MADIVIRGMDMPEDGCFRCWMDNYCFKMGYGKFGNNGACPLFPLPEGHGELIDKQAFIADIAGFIKRMSNVGVLVDGETMWGKLLDALANAKTIVPAEGGNADGN